MAFQYTTKLYLLAVCLVQDYFTYAIPGTITPLDPIVAVGSNINITCMLITNQTTYTAADIIWKKNYLNLIDPSNVEVVSNSVAMLRLENLTLDNNDDNYYCHLPDEQPIDWIGTSLHIGLPPTEPYLKCFSTNIIDYWCEWSMIEETYLINTYTFQLEYPIGFLSEWRPCPKYVDEYTCNVPLSDDDGNPLNPGIQHDVRVIVQNFLGNATTQITFWPEIQAVPLPPIIESVNASQLSMRVKLKLQEDINVYKNSLRYHTRYSTSTEPENWIEDPILDNRNLDITIRGLEYYTLYNLQARSQFKNNEWSEWGDTFQARTLETEPEGFVNLTITEIVRTFTRTILLEWTKFPESKLNGKLLGYKVKLWKSDSITKIEEIELDANAISHLLKEIKLFEEFYVSVVAYNSVGETREDKKQLLDKSNEPGKPVDINGEVLSSNTIRISWGVPQKPGSLNLTYKLEWFTFGINYKSVMINSNAMEEPTVSYLVANLNAYTSYQFKVRAENHMGSGIYSELIQLRTFESVPGNISTLTVESDINYATVLRLSWTPPTHPNGIITSYNLYYQKLLSGPVHKVSVTPGNEFMYLLDDLEAYQTYSLWMTANNSAGEGASSLKVTQRTSQGIPSEPQHLTVNQITSSSFMIYWDPPEKINGIFKHYKIRWRDLNDSRYSEKNVNTTSSKIVSLFGHTDYEVYVSACTERLADHACSQEASLVDPIKTLIGVPGPPQHLEVESKSSETIEVSWQAPKIPNGPIDHYLVVYSHQNIAEVTKREQGTTLTLGVSCNVEETLNYTFNVQAVNVDQNTMYLSGPKVSNSYEFRCNPNSDPTIILYVLVPSVLVLIFVLLGFIFKNKYHDKYFTAWPEPKIVQVMIDPELSPPPIEKEMFDDLKKRPHSQSSSSTSSDQGFHEMSLSLSRIELKTQEQTVHYDNTSHTRSDSLSDDLDDDPFYPPEHDVGIQKENLCQSAETSPNTGQEYFHITYECNLRSDELQYHHMLAQGSQEELTYSGCDNSNRARQSEQSDLPDTDAYVKLVPSSPTGSNTHQSSDNDYENGENCTYITGVILDEKKEFDSVTDSTSAEVLKNELSQSNTVLSGDYVTSNNFRLMHQVSNLPAEDSSSTASLIDDYSQVEMSNLSEFLDNIACTVED